MAGRESGHIPGLDGLRALAVVAVIAEHLRLPASALGWTGVNLFFVLSGFLITNILLSGRDSPGYFRVFYARRALRIFPIYYLVIGALAVLSIMAGQSVSHWPFFATYTQNWLWAFSGSFADDGRIHFSWGASHTWSLAIEEQFYFLWPLAVRFLGAKALLRLTIGIIVLGALSRFAAVQLSGKWWLGYVPLFSQMDMLAWGALGAILSRRGFDLKVPARWGLGLMGLVMLVGFGLYHHEMRTPERLLGVKAGHVVFTALGPFFLSLLLVARHAGVMTRLLELPPIRYVARISYGLYLYHWPILVLTEAQPGLGPTQRVLLVLAATFATASASYFFIERPLLRLKDRFFGRSEPEGRPAAAAGAPTPAPA